VSRPESAEGQDVSTEKEGGPTSFFRKSKKKEGFGNQQKGAGPKGRTWGSSSLYGAKGQKTYPYQFVEGEEELEGKGQKLERDFFRGTLLGSR